jgi:hypothetical protein
VWTHTQKKRKERSQKEPMLSFIKKEGVGSIVIYISQFRTREDKMICCPLYNCFEWSIKKKKKIKEINKFSMAQVFNRPKMFTLTPCVREKIVFFFFSWSSGCSCLVNLVNRVGARGPPPLVIYWSRGPHWKNIPTNI